MCFKPPSYQNLYTTKLMYNFFRFKNEIQKSQLIFLRKTQGFLCSNYLVLCFERSLLTLLFVVIVVIFAILVVITIATIVVLIFFWFSSKMATSQFEFLKFQNTRISLIVPITSLISQNCQFGRLAINYSKSPNLHFRSIWSNVTHSPDNPVNVSIESRNVRKIGTVSSNRIYKMHEITLTQVILTHCTL